MRKRSPVGQLAPAVAVAVDVAVQVEQRTRLGAVEFAHLRLEPRVVAPDLRCDVRLRRDRLAAPRQADLAIDVHRQRDGPAQCHLLRRVATDHRVFHREVRHRDIVALVAHHVDAASRQMRRQLAVGQRLFGELVGHSLDDVLLLTQERQPARLRFFDHRDLDTIDHRQSSPLQGSGDALPAWIVGRGPFVVQLLAKVRVALQHDARTAAPRRQPERPRTDGVFAHLVAIALHHLARHRAGQRWIGEEMVKARSGQGQPHLEAVAIEYPQAAHVAVVVERLVFLNHLAAQLAQAQDLRGLELVQLASSSSAGRSGA